MMPKTIASGFSVDALSSPSPNAAAIAACGMPNAPKRANQPMGKGVSVLPLVSNEGVGREVGGSPPPVVLIVPATAPEIPATSANRCQYLRLSDSTG